jgi:hypothetical protein
MHLITISLEYRGAYHDCLRWLGTTDDPRAKNNRAIKLELDILFSFICRFEQIRRNLVIVIYYVIRLTNKNLFTVGSKPPVL